MRTFTVSIYTNGRLEQRNADLSFAGLAEIFRKHRTPQIRSYGEKVFSFVSASPNTLVEVSLAIDLPDGARAKVFIHTHNVDPE